MAKAPSLLERYGLPPREIQARSFEIVSGLLPPLDLTEDERQVLVRMVHTTGDPGIAEAVRFHPRAVECGVAALRQGRPIYTDVRMAAAGVSADLAARLGCPVRCLLDAPGVVALAHAEGITRATASVRLMAEELPGAVVVIGNAPTALLALLDLIDAGLAPSALIVGVPVGFVSAAESKEELVSRSVPFISLLGTRGGSPVAAATVNALLRLAAGASPTD